MAFIKAYKGDGHIGWVNTAFVKRAYLNHLSMKSPLDLILEDTDGNEWSLHCPDFKSVSEAEKFADEMFGRDKPC